MSLVTRNQRTETRRKIRTLGLRTAHDAIRTTQYTRRTNFYRPTWAEVNLSAIEYNFRQVRKLVGDRAGILVAVKADAYGHGAYEVSKTLEGCGADYLGVASVDEAVELRKKGIKSPIIILCAIFEDEMETAVKYDVTATVADIESTRSLAKAASKLGRTAKVHIKVDTGMGRLGIWHDEADILVREVSCLENLFLEGIYTHFPSAEEMDGLFTREQMRAFNRLLEKIEKRGIKINYKHTANSMAVIGYKESHLNLVRPGLMIYGMYPDYIARKMVSLKPALSFKTKIVFLKDVPKGRTISYGRTYSTKKETLIATLPVGYGDGYNRLLSNKAYALIRGVRAPVVGRVCMDQTMVDVGSVKGAAIGDEAVLIGAQGKERISAEELAALCNTIPYEITCWISKRVPRIYGDTFLQNKR